jgi:CheY-like chemotaxis protein
MPAQAVPQSRDVLRGMAVLVVDDNATNRHILDAMLTGWGMRPMLVDGGEAALRAMESEQQNGTPFSARVAGLSDAEHERARGSGAYQEPPGAGGGVRS